MPTDSVAVLLTVLQSGLVVSGNADITLARSVTSGDALSNQRISGRTDFIYLYQGRTDITPLTGGGFYEAADYVVAELNVRYPTATTTNANTTLQTRVDDFKTTVASGAWPLSGVPMPFLVAEEHPMAHANVAKAKLTYRLRYLDPT